MRRKSFRDSVARIEKEATDRYLTLQDLVIKNQRRLQEKIEPYLKERFRRSSELTRRLIENSFHRRSKGT